MLPTSWVARRREEKRRAERRFKAILLCHGLASQIYDVLQKKGGFVCSPTFFLTSNCCQFPKWDSLSVESPYCE